jgi:hypothetical protein
LKFGRRRANWWIALVLPGLLLRALIPIGFMPVFGAHVGVQLSMCDGYAPVAFAAMQMPADMPMDMHPGGKSAHSVCPYGASAALASPLMLGEAPSIVPICAQRQVARAQIAHFEMALRTQSPRGPPTNA